MRDPSVSATSEKLTVVRLKRRADFVRAGKGRRWHGAALSLQAIQMAQAREGTSFEGERLDAARVGFTLTRKVGNSVVRNRARRRLKEALRLSPGLSLKAGHDYVVIGRIDAIRISFGALQDELARAIAGVHRNRRGGSSRDEPQRIRPTP